MSDRIRCPRCFGRGYIPEARKGGGPGFYARNCPRCGGRGECEPPRSRASVAADIRRGRLPQGYELTLTDVGRSLTGPSEGFGKARAGDVGKRCYVRPHGFEMENNAQRDARLTR